MAGSLTDRLKEDPILIVPGAYDALMARLIEVSGFEAMYLSGAGVSYGMLGQPDVGLVTLSEMVNHISYIAQAVEIPIIADGDTGYGNAINVRRTVQLYEAAGASAIQLEDQSFPKRCGHLGGKDLISQEEMVGKIQSAMDGRRSGNFLVIARTDALGVEGMDKALNRGQAYVAAGADLLFIEAPGSEGALLEIANAFPKTPLVANMVEGGKTPLLPAAQLQEMGYALVLYPNSMTRRFARAGLDLLANLQTQGTTANMMDSMLTHQELSELLGLDSIHEQERLYLPSIDTNMATKSEGTS